MQRNIYMVEFETFQKEAIRNEIRLAINIITKGINKISKIDSTDFDYFEPFLFLSVGYERIMKILIILNEYENKQKKLTIEEIKEKGHKLVELKNNILSILNHNPNYKIIPQRKKDIDFLNQHANFNEFLQILSDFAWKNRYYNIDYILDNTKEYDLINNRFNNYRNEIFRNKFPDDNNELIGEIDIHSNAFIDKVNCYIECTLKLFTKILSLCFTQGAFGNKARQFSAGLLNDYLNLDYNQLKSNI